MEEGGRKRGGGRRERRECQHTIRELRDREDLLGPSFGGSL